MDYTELNNIFESLIDKVRTQLKEELDSGRITKSEYGDILSQSVTAIINQSSSLYTSTVQLEIEKERLKQEKENTKNIVAQRELIEIQAKNERLKDELIKAQIERELKTTDKIIADTVIAEKQALSLDKDITMKQLETDIKTYYKENIQPIELELKKAQLCSEQKMCIINSYKAQEEQYNYDNILPLKVEELTMNTSFVSRQIKSFDEKKYLELLDMEMKAWGAMLSSGLIELVDENGNITGTIPDILKNSYVLDLYNKITT